jgi:hypothetical protein
MLSARGTGSAHGRRRPAHNDSSRLPIASGQNHRYPLIRIRFRALRSRCLPEEGATGDRPNPFSGGRDRLDAIARAARVSSLSRNHQLSAQPIRSAKPAARTHLPYALLTFFHFSRAGDQALSDGWFDEILSSSRLRSSFANWMAVTNSPMSQRVLYHSVNSPSRSVTR